MTRILDEMIDVATPVGMMPAYLARPERDEPVPAVLVMMEGVGLNAHLRSVACRLADEGYVACAPDLYWRGGKGRSVSYDEIPKAWSMMGELYSPDSTRLGDWLETDIGAAIAHLKDGPFVQGDRIGVTGFCLGGRITMDVACEFPDAIMAAAPFYGAGIPFSSLHKLRAPLLGFYGDDDPFIPNADVERLRHECQRLGKQAEIVVYPGATHGFFCDDRPASYHLEAARDAWERLKVFFARHLTNP